MKHYSHSQLNAYDCPQLYKRSYKDEIKTIPTENMEEGTGRHAVVHNAIIGQDFRGLSPKLTRFLELRRTKYPFISEREFTLDFITTEFVGRIDLVILGDGRATVVDWKGAVLPDDPAQLETYAIKIFLDSPDLMMLEGIFYSLVNDRYKTFMISRADAAARETEILKTIRKIEEDTTWERRPGPRCKTCGYVENCLKEADKKFSLVSCANQKEFEALWAKFELLGAMYDQAKDTLQQYMEERDIERVVNERDRTKIYLATYTTLKAGGLNKQELKELAAQEEQKKLNPPEPPQFDHLHGEIIASKNIPAGDTVMDVVASIKNSGPGEEIILSVTEPPHISEVESTPSGQMVMDTVPNAANATLPPPSMADVERYMIEMDTLRFPLNSTEGIADLSDLIGRNWYATNDDIRDAMTKLRSEYEKRHGIGQVPPAPDPKSDLPFGDAPADGDDDEDKPGRFTSGKLYELIVALGRGKKRASSAEKHRAILGEMGRHWLDSTPEMREACRAKLQDELDARNSGATK